MSVLLVDHPKTNQGKITINQNVVDEENNTKDPPSAEKRIINKK
jgi:hypothetical protein